MALSPILLLLAVIVVPTVFVLLVMYVFIPLARGLGWLIVNGFRSVGWFFAHIFEYVGGTIGDAFRFLSTLPAMLVLSVMTLFSVALGRWSSAAHFGRSVRREFVTAGTCIYGVFLRRPLKLVWLHGLLSGIEHRVPEAMAAAPGRDRPSRANQFDGYTIIGSLPSGGSGAKLYIAEPDARTRGRIKGMPEQVVIKSFALEEGSALPQIVRESRALESAKKLKAVYEHGMDANRFWYAMPYYRGDHLGIITRQLHAESGESGLGVRHLRTGVGYVAQLAETLLSYHREGLWHKDVKPENVIIGADGAHLVDLGLVTPLHSAMTLTTHGTEYFRDPELVRQALRGVKVHQVDGAKFDVFGIGAVLYFMIENDFPAHGPLSRFSKKSPDAIKWIIRRAMADYHHRYDSAEQLVADLRVVASATDPFAVKPIELPSVRARAAADADPMDDAGFEVDVAEETERDAAAGIGRGGRMAGAVGAGGAAAAAAAAGAAAAGRPRIRRRGFFSGAYDVVDQTARSLDETMRGVDDRMAGKGSGDDVTVVGFGLGTGSSREAKVRARAIRREARRRMQDARVHAQRAVKDARRGTRRARKAAAAAAGRHASKARRPRPIEGVVGAMIFAGVVAAVVFGLLFAETGPLGSRYAGVNAGPTVTEARAERPVVALLTSQALRELEPGRAVIDRIVAQRESQGYEVIELPDAATARLLETLTWWEVSDRSGEADRVLEDQLEAWGLYGVLDLGTGRSGGVDDRLVFSTRAGADERIPLTRRINLPDPSLPLLLVNDHPRHVSPVVSARIDRMIAGLSDLGWTISRDPDVEADLRTVLPIRTDATDVPMTPVLAEKLQRHDLGGVLRVIGTAEDDDDVMLQVVRPDEVRAHTLPLPPAPMVPDPPAGPASQSLAPMPGQPSAPAASTATASRTWAGMQAPPVVHDARVRIDRERGAGAGAAAASEPARSFSGVNVFGPRD